MATAADAQGGRDLDPELDPDAAQDAIEYCYAQGWSDGLPVVPATEPLVQQFLAQTGRPPDEVLWRMDHLGRECTVRTAAINAAMAGCLPEYFPVVLAAWDAVMLDRAAKGGGWQSTSGPSPMIVVNGPIRQRLGLNCTGGVFAAGFRPNATIPRAIGLMIRNAFGIRPHVFDQATQGLPGRFSICFGENEEQSPWEPLAQSTGLPAGTDAVSATLLRTCEYVDNRHTQNAEQLLWDFSDTMARSGALLFATESVGLVLCPEHAQMLSGAGYSRGDVQAWFVEHCTKTAAELHRAGKYAMSGGHGVRSGSDEPVADPGELTHILPGPESVPVLVAGARNAAMSMVVRVFGEWSNQSVAIESAPTTQGA
jgi:hypothetical protein